MNEIGIDVDSRFLVCAIRRNGRPSATPALADNFAIMSSTTGIAETAGVRILAKLAALPHDMRAPQWVAHTGLDPRPCESGKSIHKPHRIRKFGNRYLREALYMPAPVAIRRDTNVKAFYEKLRLRTLGSF